MSDDTCMIIARYWVTMGVALAICGPRSRSQFLYIQYLVEGKNTPATIDESEVVMLVSGWLYHISWRWSVLVSKISTSSFLLLMG